MIAAERLSRDYGRTHALHEVSFRVEAGETVAVLGPNGAGKSTLLQILAGILRPTGGHADVAGLRVPGDEARLGARVGFVPQGESVYPELTVRENLRFFGRAHGVPRRELDARIDRVLDAMRLTERAREQAGRLSGGLRQRVAVAASILHEPRALLLDEPATGLDPVARGRLHETLRALGEERAILFSTHNFEDAAALAHRVVMLSRGRIAATRPGGDAAALAAAFQQLEAQA